MSRKLTDIENRLRRVGWPTPSADLRARVLSAPPVISRPRAWSDHAMADSVLQPRTLWHYSGVFAVLGIVVILGSCSGLDLVADRQLDEEVARLELRYGSLNETTLMAPSVAPADNRARIAKAAADLTIPLHTYFDLRALDPVPAELRAFAEKNQPAVRMAGEIRTRQRSNWNGGNPKMDEVGIPWEGLRALTDAIYVTALLELEAGQAENAAQTMVSGLGVSASLRQEPDVVAQLMRVTFAHRHLEGIRQIVTKGELSKSALEELARWLEENRMPDPMQFALLVTLKESNTIMSRMENGDIDLGVASYVWPSWPPAYLGPVARIGRPLVRVGRLRFLRRVAYLLDAQSGPRPRPSSPEPPAPKPWDLIGRLTDKFTSGIEGFGDNGDDFNSALGAAELAVALRRFKLDHGAYPDDLSALAPQYLSRVPIDPYTGHPPVYTPLQAGFTLRAQGSGPLVARWLALEWNLRRGTR